MDKIGIGIDIGGTEIKAAKFNLISGKILDKKMFPTNKIKFSSFNLSSSYINSNSNLIHIKCIIYTIQRISIIINQSCSIMTID